ncbi:hypothetical protein GCM10023115_12220 [Pontixanthobacter gangjinensis]
MKDVRFKRLDIFTDPFRNAQRKPEFAATGKWDGWQADKIALRFKRRRLRGRRIDADLRALTQQIFNEAIKRLIRAIANVVIIAAKKGNAKIRRLHGWSALSCRAAFGESELAVNLEPSTAS